MAEPSGTGLRVLIADDHPMVSDLLDVYMRRALPKAEVICVADLAAARAALTDGPPCHLALLDLQMPGMTGAAAVAALRGDFPETPLAILSGTTDRRQVRACLGAGAVGFVPKTLPGRTIIDAIRLMAGGATYVPTEMLNHDEEEEHESAAGPALTPREREVLALVLRGTPNKVIAHELQISEPTVKLHLRGLFRKFAVGNRTQLVAEAMGTGFAPARTTCPNG